MSAPLLVGQLCVLRPLESDDVERLVEIQSEPSVARWWNLPDAQELRQKIEGRTEPLEVLPGIERDGHLIGMIQYFEEGGPDFRHAGIDLFIATEHQRHGIGTDAVRTLARHLIDERGHHRLTIDPTSTTQPRSAPTRRSASAPWGDARILALARRRVARWAADGPPRARVRALRPPRSYPLG